VRSRGADARQYVALPEATQWRSAAPQASTGIHLVLPGILARMGAVRELLGAYFEALAATQARILLSLVYWTALAAAKAFLVLGRRRLLPNTFRSASSHWIERAPAEVDPVALGRQY